MLQTIQLLELVRENQAKQRLKELPEQLLVKLRRQRAEQQRIEVAVQLEMQVAIQLSMRRAMQARMQLKTYLPELLHVLLRVLREMQPLLRTVQGLEYRSRMRNSGFPCRHCSSTGLGDRVGA